MNRILLIFEAFWQLKKIHLQFFTRDEFDTRIYRLITFKFIEDSAQLFQNEYLAFRS